MKIYSILHVAKSANACQLNTSLVIEYQLITITFIDHVQVIRVEFKRSLFRLRHNQLRALSNLALKFPRFSHPLDVCGKRYSFHSQCHSIKVVLLENLTPWLHCTEFTSMSWAFSFFSSNLYRGPPTYIISKE